MLQIIPIPAFEDNYLWLIVRGRHAAVVDPGDAEPVLQYLDHHQLSLCAILCTHHHGDHVGGNRILLQRFSVPVYGPARETIPGLTNKVAEGDRISLPQLDLELHVLDVPGHTIGHVAYYGAESLFCGDALFACGCGRIFEGTPQQMHESLSKIAQLPDNTRIYCAHEYTLDNIRFAKVAEPHNDVLLEREAHDRATRAKHQPTVPSLLALEKATNPFLRSEVPNLKQAAETYAGHPLPEPWQVFAVVRAWKDALD